MISQAGLAWKRGDKKWEGGRKWSAELNIILGGHACVCVCVWIHELGRCVWESGKGVVNMSVLISNTSWTSGCLQPLRHRHRHTHTDTLIHLRPCARNVHFIDHPAHVTETIDASYITWCCMETHTRLSSFKLAEVSTLVSRFFWSPRASLNVHPSTWLMPNPMKFLRLVLSERLACVQVSPSATVCQLVCLCWHLNQNNYRLPQLCVTMATFPSSHQSYLWW